MKLCRHPTLLLALLLLAGPARAVDGVLEINQTCAVQTGCWAGDTAGFPVRISQPGSYVLTGNLSGFTDEAILIGTSRVTVDLGGFSINGPGNCTGTPPTCNLTGSTVGVSSVMLGGVPVHHRHVVRNGFIRGVADGVRVGRSSRVEDLTVAEVANTAILALEGSQVRDNVIESVEAGVAVNTLGGGCLVSDNSIRNVGFYPLNVETGSAFRDNVIADAVPAFSAVVAGGRAIGSNLCNNELCTAPVRRRFYLTQQTFDGAQAPGACAEGFHMASIWEIRDTTTLDYDTSLGLVLDDSGDGPPSEFGWLRTGAAGNGWGGAGTGNCLAYTSNSSSDSGSWARPYGGEWGDADWTSTSFHEMSWTWGWDGPTTLASARCDFDHHVWCVQDD